MPPTSSAPCPRAWIAAGEPAVGEVRQLPVDRIRTRYAALRLGRLTSPRTGLADGPLRVVPAGDGHYEILDGFKFFERWCDAGHRTVAAIVERPLSAIEHKRLMLAANTPPRTITAADEDSQLPAPGEVPGRA